MFSKLIVNFSRRTLFSPNFQNRLVSTRLDLGPRDFHDCCEEDAGCYDESSGSDGDDGSCGGQFPTVTRPIEPGKVRLGFLPEEWFQFLYPKTGVTGPYMFGVGLLTYLFSKEIYVMEHEFYSGLSLAIMCIVAVKKLGPLTAQWADKEVDSVENEWKQGRIDQLEEIKKAIEREKLEQWRAEGARMLVDAKRENIAMQIEAAYREEAWKCYEEVKNRLDYQVACRNIENRLNRKNMVQWVVKNVLAEISTGREDEIIQKNIADLSAMAVRMK